MLIQSRSRFKGASFCEDLENQIDDKQSGWLSVQFG